MAIPGMTDHYQAHEKLAFVPAARKNLGRQRSVWLNGARNPGMPQQPGSVGRYRIIRRLGQGAMGIVYLAHDPTIERSVAIKLLPPLVEDQHADLRERFTREMQWAGGLTHPNIAAIYDAGEAIGQPFIAMEFVDGDTLEHACIDRSPFTLRQRLSLIDQLCQGLHHAHLAKVVHRDVKPSNLLVTRDGVLKIVDFGIARLIETGVTHATVAGTIGYMAPEQLRGEPVDHRVDMFATGVVAYQLLSGAKPFPGQSLEQVILHTLTLAPARLSDVNPLVSVDLSQIVHRALEKKPEDRFENLEAMRVALRTVGSQMIDGALDGPISPSAWSADIAPSLRASPPATAALDVVDGVAVDVAPTPVAPPSVIQLATQDMLITQRGAMTTVAVVALLAAAQAYGHIVLYQTTLLVLPISAYLFGSLAGSGYYRGALAAGRRPTQRVLVAMIAIAVASYCLIPALTYWWMKVGNLPVAQVIPFNAFFDVWVRSSQVHIETFNFDRWLGNSGVRPFSTTFDVGHFGYVISLLNAAGFALGGVLAYLAALGKPFCKTCQRYLSDPISVAGFSAFESDVDRVLDQAQRFTAAGNTVRAVALVQALDQSESAFQLQMRSWRCGRCAREYAMFELSKYVGSRWVRMQVKRVDGIAVGPAASPTVSGVSTMLPGQTEPAHPPAEEVRDTPVAGRPSLLHDLVLAGLLSLERFLPADLRHGLRAIEAQFVWITATTLIASLSVAASVYVWTRPAQPLTYASAPAVEAASLAADSIASLQRRCDAGEMSQCFLLGVHYSRGIGVDVSAIRAEALYERACDGNIADACSELGLLLFDGAGVPKDATRAATLLTKACEGKSPKGCALLGLAYDTGAGVAADPVRAADLYRRACDDGAPGGCSKLGQMYEAGRAVSPDAVQALYLYSRGCTGGNWLGCDRLAVLYETGKSVVKDEARSRELFSKACEGGYGPSCARLAFLYENGRGGPVDAARAATLFDRSCSAAFAAGCTALAAMLNTGEGIATDSHRAALLFKKGCDNGDAPGCHDLAVLYQSGRGVAHDPTSAKLFFERACELGDKSACGLASRLIPERPARAR
jgi:TPR repeat protein